MTTERQRSNRINQAIRLATELAHIHAQALNQLDEWSAGYPSGSSGPSSDTTDRTGTLATAHCAYRHHVLTIDHDLHTAVTVLEDALWRARLGLAPAHDERERLPACKSCARTNDHHGQALNTPAWKADLCRWCYDWSRTHHAWPALQILRAHHRGETITDRMIRRYQRSG